MTSPVFDKTEKGREEISTRKYQLPPRLRTLLVLIDGKQSTGELLQKVGGLGLNEQSIVELQENGFIAPVALPLITTVAKPQADAQETVAVAAVLAPGQSQFQAIYQFYTETIRSTIGLRGYGLQLKVEKAASVEELRELRQPYLDAVLKAKGNEIAQSLRARLDQLLNAGQPGGTAPA